MVVRRGRLMDRGTNRPGGGGESDLGLIPARMRLGDETKLPPFAKCILMGMFWMAASGLLIGGGLLVLGRLSFGVFWIVLFNCVALGLI